MEQSVRRTWTDERMDDFAARVDQRFDAVDRRFDRVDQELRDVRGQLESLRDHVVRANLGMMLGFVTVLAAIVARG